MSTENTSRSFYELFDKHNIEERRDLDIYSDMLREMCDLGHRVIITFNAGFITVANDIGGNDQAYYSPIKTISLQNEHNEFMRKLAFNKLYEFLATFIHCVRIEKTMQLRKV